MRKNLSVNRYFSINRFEGDIRAGSQQFKRDLLESKSRSIIHTIWIVFWQALIGLLPIVWLILIANFFEAFVAARNVGIWIDELTSIFWTSGVTLFITLLAIWATARLKGSYERMARVTRWMFLATGIYVTLLVYTPILVSFSALLMITEPWMSKRGRALAWAVIWMMVLLFSQTILLDGVERLLPLADTFFLTALAWLIPFRRIADRYMVCA